MRLQEGNTLSYPLTSPLPCMIPLNKQDVQSMLGMLPGSPTLSVLYKGTTGEEGLKSGWIADSRLASC